MRFRCTGDDVGEFQLGSDVIITYEKVEYPGRIAMTTLSKPADGAFIRAEIDGTLPKDNLELLGRTVSVKLIRQKKTDAVIVPRNTVSSYSGESYVLVLEDGVKKERPVETGIKTTSYVEIVEGLSPGEEVIIK